MASWRALFAGAVLFGHVSVGGLPAQEPVNHYTFDGLLEDEVGQNDGVFAGGLEIDPTFVDGFDGVPEGAIRFDGLDDVVTINREVQDEMTLACWVRMDIPQAATNDGSQFWMGSALIQGERPGCTGDAGLVMIGSSAAFGYGCPDVTARGTSALDDGAWHHVAGIRRFDFDRGVAVVEIWVDGVLETQVDHPSMDPVTAHDTFTIGGDTVGNLYFTGDIDDVRIYDSALGFAAIEALARPDCDGVATIVRTLSSDTVRPGEELEVTLSASDVSEALTVTDTFPDGLMATAANGGEVAGNTITFVFGGDGDMTYSLEAVGGSCPFLDDLFSGSVTPPECAAIAGDRALRCLDPPSLVNHWTFDGTLEDEERDNEGVFTGGLELEPVYVEGFDGEDPGAIRLDGIDDHVTAQRQVQDAMTLACWVRADGPQVNLGAQYWQGSGLIYADVPGGADDFGMSINGSSLAFGIGNPDTTVQGVSSVTTGEWVHLAASREIDEGLGVSVLRVYVNGALDGELQAPNTATLDASAEITIGANALDNRRFTGDIDDVRIFNYALSPEEIRELSNPQCDSVVAVVRSLSSDRVTPGGEPLVVTLSATQVTGPITVSDRFPAGLTVTAANGGTVVGNTIGFDVSADEVLSYTLEVDGGDCAFVNASFEGSVSPSLCASFSGVSGLRCIPAPSLVGHWTLDGTLSDEVAGNDGVYSLGGLDPVYAEGFDGEDPGAMTYGVGDFVTVQRVVEDEMTLSCWVKTTAFQVDDGVQYYQGAGLVYADVAFTANDFGMSINGDLVSFGIGNPDMTVLGITSVTTGEWVHLAAVRAVEEGAEPGVDVSKLRIYVDGVLDGELEHPNIAPLNASPEITLGGNAIDNRLYVGDLDDVRIYNYALSDEEIQDLAEGGGIIQPSGGFRRGDTDASGVIDISDPIFNLTFQFVGGIEQLPCPDAADVDDSGLIDISDPIFNLTFQFVGGIAAPPAPGPSNCGPDPTPDNKIPTDPPGGPNDELGCESYPQERCAGE